ncbi:diaminopimelate epimerase [Jatrophihabitans sp. GAS493]|uniref:diaminopimelate epimerase n=1 Tax=Jatrophihabitans sp. GAS493 TaxID=1907575 RepID=UPI000BC0D913|nr:diaminopimelate epimerase [Jatrophihabitans sp. GAS493]SOD74126.1 diaminopimelate epimerase [Jatrophihabitans sp. GAS493]
MDALQVMKGHGTENDFVVIADLDNSLDLTDHLVRALCDRRAGIGADGVLRVVASEHEPSAAADQAIAPYFMDYRNADGSLAQMCGNGVRVFVRYLQSQGLTGERVVVATRGGLKPTWLNDDGSISVEMGQPELLTERPLVQTHGGPALASSYALNIPNPHVIVPVSSSEELAELDLDRAPAVSPALPDGQNIEFVVQLGPRHLQMRVHERGVGETRSCGTGICAAVVASALAADTPQDDTRWRVDVPGGTCSVVWRTDGSVVMTGPAVLVATIDIDAQWLARAKQCD